MNKILCAAILLVSIGCNRDYTCHCVVSHSSSTSNVFYPVGNSTLKKAKSTCDQLEDAAIVAAADSSQLNIAQAECRIE